MIVSVSQAVRAERKERKSDQVARFLKDMLTGVEPSVAMGRDTRMLREILDQTADRVGRDLKNLPEVEAELRGTIGDVYQLISEYEKAEAMYRRALELVCGEFEDKTWKAFWTTTVEGKSATEAAAALGLSSAAVRQAKSRVLRRLKEEVGELIE